MDNGLTVQEQVTNAETLEHIRLVQKLMGKIVTNLINRASVHDQSKLERPEVTIFAAAKPLAGMTYGSQEYNQNLKDIDKALEHHYARNSHHPQHHKSGIGDMSLCDIVEMFCDWAAACRRHNDGNLNKSIEHNADRFGISPQLVSILENTVDILE